MRNCFVPFCDYECRANPKRMMFIPPRDEKLFEMWKNVLPKKRLLKKHDKVCERHFNASEISTTFEHIIKGEHFTMARGKPKLKDCVVPSRNLPHDDELPIIKRGRKTGFKVSKIPKKKRKKSIASKVENIISIVEEPSNVDTIAEIEINNQLTNIEKQHNEDLNNLVATNNEDNSPFEETFDKQFFENIYEDIFEVVLPNTLWGIHRDPSKEFIAFSYYDPSIRKTTKIIELTNQATLKIIMCNKIITEENYFTEITPERISNILNKADEASICKMAFTNIDLCQVDVISSDYCQSCLENQIKDK